MRTILLSAPSAVSVLIASVPGSRIRSGGGGEELRQDRGAPDEQPCPADPAARSVPPITKPALGMSADYGLTPTPYTSDPDPLGKIISAAGTHYELSWIADMAFGATLHGADEVAWYTTAWFDKYVKETTQLPSTLAELPRCNTSVLTYPPPSIPPNSGLRRSPSSASVMLGLFLADSADP